MEYLLTCECGQQNRVMRSQAGQDIRCQCGAVLRVPTLRGLADLPVAEPEPNAVAEKSPSNRWQGWRGTVLAISAAIFILAIVPCGWFLYERARWNMNYDTQNEIEAGSSQIDQFNAADVVSNWYAFERYGLTNKSKPDYYYIKQYLREREILAAITGTVASIAGLVAMALIFTGKKRPRSASPS